jgi:hypothetical protein
MPNLSALIARMSLTLWLKRKDYMNDGSQNVVNTTTTVANTTQNVATQPTQKTEVKTFTQEEVNSMIQERLAREKKNMPTEDELKEFNTWKESKKTEAEKYQEVIKENASLKAKVQDFENMSVVRNAGVESKFEKFVYSEVKDMEGNIEDNLKEYLKNNPQYLQKQTEKPKSTGFSQNGSNNTVSDEKAYLDKKYANNPYYKK